LGKPYATELEQLASVYAWASHFELESLVTAVISFAAKPLIIVGSGGSLTGAHLASYLHQRFAQRLARTVTPLEIATLPPLHDTGALILTASGRNPDIIGALRVLAEREPRELAFFCAAVATPLAESASSYFYVKPIEFEPPTGKDGFVATNTLLATAVLLTRAYEQVYTPQRPLPCTLPELFGGDDAFSQFLVTTRQNSQLIFQREHLVIL
jgi:fructoselysine-6-P-deglycase FrlB-like protein